MPWPTFAPGVAGGVVGTAAGDTKKRIFAALRRWHPDKWQAKSGTMAAVGTRVFQVLQEEKESLFR